MSGIVTLMSDFGEQDVYVAVMKGVIAGINPHLTVVDLTHAIPPQDINSGQFQLGNAAPYFPTGTVHVAVIDPGVGSQRRAVAIACECGILVGPDNGLFSQLCDRYPPTAAVELTNPAYWRVQSPSATFHGRDIFAPVGAHLASGVPLARVGTPIHLRKLVRHSFPAVRREENRLIGTIQTCDRFGNCISTISEQDVQGYDWEAIVNGQSLSRGYTYSDVCWGEPLALIGSHGWVELAVNGGNARDRLQLQCDDKVEIRLLDSPRDSAQSDPPSPLSTSL
ncbi:MAG: S-adenosyl-l-methionine hydroxide adenosyltransferase family protein [Synechococcus sp.]